MKGQNPVDILKLYAEWDVQKWNKWLWKHAKARNVSALLETRKNLQLGMDSLVKKSMNTEKVSILFIRLQRSIDNTIKDIYRFENQNPLDNPLNAHLKSQFIDEKRKRDHNLETFIKSKTW